MTLLYDEPFAKCPPYLRGDNMFTNKTLQRLAGALLLCASLCVSVMSPSGYATNSHQDLMCEGDVNFVIKPQHKTMMFLTSEGTFLVTDVESFSTYRGKHVYEIKGRVRHPDFEEPIPFEIRTDGRDPENDITATADISVPGEDRPAHITVICREVDPILL